MPDEEAVIQEPTAEETAIQEPTAEETAIQEPTAEETAIQEPTAEETAIADDEWADEPVEELPRRPRRRLLGAGGNGVGGNPIFPALLGVLLIVCGFIAGVLVEKGQTSSGSPGGAAAAGLGSRFAALRSASGGGAFAGGAGTSASGGATVGQVAYVSGHTLYVTNAEGNTVKVTTSAASTVTKTVKTDVQGIHPGETVVVMGTAGAKGVLSAESIRVGGGASGGGLGGLFGGAGAGTSRGGRSGGHTGSSSGEPALFGNGG